MCPLGQGLPVKYSRRPLAFAALRDILRMRAGAVVAPRVPSAET
jgi:hypothetical protein